MYACTCIPTIARIRMSIRRLWESEWESLQIFVVTAAAVRSPLFWSQTAEVEVFCESRNALLLLQVRLGG